jgi:hypothetical protein
MLESTATHAGVILPVFFPYFHKNIHFFLYAFPEKIRIRRLSNTLQTTFPSFGVQGFWVLTNILQIFNNFLTNLIQKKPKLETDEEL